MSNRFQLSDFVGSVGLYAEGVDIAFQQAVEGLIYESVSLDLSMPPKFVGNDQYREVPAAIPGACMTNVHVAVVRDLNHLRLECLLQRFSYSVFPVIHRLEP